MTDHDIVHDPRQVDPGAEEPLPPVPPPGAEVAGDPDAQRMADPRLGETDDPLEDGADDYDA